MVTTIALVLLPLATILMSGVTSAAVTYRLNRNKEHTFFMRQKAEQLYLASDEFGRALGIHMFPYLSVLDGSLDYNQLLDIELTNPPKKAHGGAETMEMLARIYFPELEPQLLEILAARDEFSAVRGEHKAAYKEGDFNGDYWRPAFLKAIGRANAAIDTLKTSVIASARRYGETGGRAAAGSAHS